MSMRSLVFLGFGTLFGGAVLAGCGGGGSGNNRMQELVCDDGVDQDQDGLTDCDDPDCRNTAACGGSSDTETDCANGLDDDDDGSTDCEDRDCVDTAACTDGEICNDGEDNDDDGDVDCADDDCSGSSYCTSTEICDDGIDNDDDGYIDCGDSQCATHVSCAPADCVAGQCLCLAPGTISLPSDVLSGDLATTDAQGGPRGSSNYYDAYEFAAAAGEAITFELIAGDFDTYLYLIGPDCSTVASNDDGGSGLLSLISYTFTSGGTYTIVVTQFSSDTGAYTLEVRPGPTATYETDCTNGIDEDDDGYVDCEDSDCYGMTGCIETDCSNGIDDDADGYIDCDDGDCYGMTGCIETDCSNGIDDDDDGYIDCNDGDCEYDADCVEPEDCGDGLDNDQDGYTDCADTDCTDEPNCAPLVCTTGACLCAEPVSIGFPNGMQSGVLATSDETGGPRGTSYYYDAYEFTATAGDIATFELIEGDFDTYLYLVGPTCTSLTSNDDGGSGLLSMISSYSFTTTGTYTIVVTQFSSSGTGAYTLQITGQ